jgi:hypothetical protein
VKELRKADREKERGSLRKAAVFFAKKQKEPELFFFCNYDNFQ